MARPTIYTDELARSICARIAEGESVRSIAKDDDMPNASTIHAWVLDNEIFSKQYAQAKRIGAEVAVDEMEEIANTYEDVQRAKLIIDTRKWALSKQIPKKYGEKNTIVTEDEDGNQHPIAFTNEQLETIFKRRGTGGATGSKK